MRNSIEWLEGGVNAAPEERATLAEWRLFLADQNVCLHLDGAESVDQLTLPLYALAEGLAHDWWTLFGGRDQALSLVRHRMGYAVPDVRLSFDGATFEIAAHQKVYRNPDVRFWGGASEVLTRGDAEEALASFITQVLERLSVSGVQTTAAALRWARVSASRVDADEAVFCEAAGALRLDPYQLSDADARLIEQSAGLFTGEALFEFLGGLRGAPIHTRTAIEWVENCDRRPYHRRRLPELRDRVHRAARAATAKAEPAWALGYRRARALRAALDYSPTEPLAGYRAIATRLGQRWFEPAPSVDGLVALRADRDDGIYVHLRRQGHDPMMKVGHTFAFARAIGDATCFPQPGRAVANDLHDARRQAAGRAFAAEFLAPVEGLLSMKNDGRDTPAIASHYGVSPAGVEHQVENAKRIADACAA